MHFLLSLVGSTVPVAHATIEQLGINSPGISDMWSQVRSVFPHTDLGAFGFNFVMLSVINFILNTISALAVVMIIYGGIKLTTGSEEALGEAKKVVTYALLGLVAAMTADAIVLYTMYVIKAAAGG